MANALRVEVWEERDRLHIALYRGDTLLADWWDDDARQMFEDGFFERGRKLESSVIAYAKDMGMTQATPAKRRRAAGGGRNPLTGPTLAAVRERAELLRRLGVTRIGVIRALEKEFPDAPKAIITTAMHEKKSQKFRRNADSTTAWGVFPHAEQRVLTGRGFVVRQMQSGFAVDQRNYGGIKPVAAFSQRGKAAAEKMATALTNKAGGYTADNPRRRKGNGVTRRRVAKENPNARQLGAFASYFALDRYLGKKNERTLANNTRVERYEQGRIAIILHSTRIVVFDVDGNVTLNSGGYHTTTTKARINQFINPHGFHLSSKRYNWIVEGHGKRYDFEDGMVLPLGSTVLPSSMGYDGPMRVNRPTKRRSKRNPILAIAGANPPKGWRKTGGGWTKVAGPASHSETMAWKEVQDLARHVMALSGRGTTHDEAYRIWNVAAQMLRQLKSGVHANPPRGGKYLGSVVEVRYIRKVGKHRNQRFRHSFKSRPALTAMPDGSIRIA